MQNFIDQMCDNVKTSLIYPYHIDPEKLVSNDGVIPAFNPEYADNYHSHSFEDVLRQAYMQPKAFYLTEADAEYYSQQEIDLINKVVEREKDKLDKGYEMVTIELTEETDELLEQYCQEHNMTFEEAVIDLLKKSIEYYGKSQKE